MHDRVTCHNDICDLFRIERLRLTQFGRRLVDSGDDQIVQLFLDLAR